MSSETTFNQDFLVGHHSQIKMTIKGKITDPKGWAKFDP
jgi:hypothetical protein